MSSHPKSSAAAALIALSLALTAWLAGCSAAPASDAPSASEAPAAPNTGSGQTVAEACSLSRDEIDTVTAEAQAGIAEAGKAVASGEIPDLSALSDALGTALDDVRAGVENSEVAEAISKVRTEVAGFAEIEKPASLIGAPAYLGSLGAQLERLNTAGKALQTLCNG